MNTDRILLYIFGVLFTFGGLFSVMVLSNHPLLSCISAFCIGVGSIAIMVGHMLSNDW